MVGLYFMSYNFGRVHQTHVRPAREAGIADHVCGIDEISDCREPKDALTWR